jgi:hypothetical protein
MLSLIMGQNLQYVSKYFAEFAVKYQKQLSKSQKFGLIFVLHTIFCDSFSSGLQQGMGNFLLALFCN